LIIVLVLPKLLLIPPNIPPAEKLPTEVPIFTAETQLFTVLYVFEYPIMPPKYTALPPSLPLKDIFPSAKEFSIIA
jgi:hypothetical protein